MIINCKKCSKNFEVEDHLISKEGTLVQCGSCQYKWFQKNEATENISKIIIDEKKLKTKNLDPSQNIDFKKKVNQTISKKPKLQTSNKHKKRLEEIESIKLEIIKERKNLKENKNNPTKLKSKKKSIGFLSIILIFLISTVALYIILDTFQYYISTYWPSFENYFYYINETLVNIYILINDLIKSYS